MKCERTVIQYVPSGYDYKAVEVRCGSTGHDGAEARCEDCSQERPWYICQHGNDISVTGYCGRCEMEG